MSKQAMHSKHSTLTKMMCPKCWTRSHFCQYDAMLANVCEYVPGYSSVVVERERELEIEHKTKPLNQKGILLTIYLSNCLHIIILLKRLPATRPYMV